MYAVRKRIFLAALAVISVTACSSDAPNVMTHDGVEITPNEDQARESGFSELVGDAPFPVEFGTGETRGSRIASYSWDFDGDGSPDSEDPTPTHRYESPGEYPAQLDVVYEDGTRSSDRQRIVVLEESSPPAPDWRFGVTAHLNRSHNLYQSDAEVERAAALLSRLGVDAVRLDMSWAAIQPDDSDTYDWSDYDWSDYDYLARTSEDYGFDLFPVLGYSSLWSSSAGFFVRDQQSVFYQPDPDEYAWFAYRAASRYEGRVRAWQVWNEPNNEYFAMPAPDARAYTKLLKKSYLAIKYADPDATVVLGGLSNDTLHSVPPEEFLDDVYRYGGGDYFDAAARHPYTTFDEGTTELQRRISGMREVMARNGDAEKPLWVTEFGSTTIPGDALEYRRQSELLVTSLDVISRSGDVSNAFWYNLRDTGDDPSTRELHYGLIERDFTPKPSYEAYRDYIRENPSP